MLFFGTCVDAICFLWLIISNLVSCWSNLCKHWAKIGSYLIKRDPCHKLKQLEIVFQSNVIQLTVTPEFIAGFSNKNLSHHEKAQVLG